MKIKTIVIDNFRSIKHVELDFKDLLILIGENNAGKTNTLKALNWFFSSSVRGLTEEDFCGKDLQNKIKITITFDRLTPEEKANRMINKYIVNDTITVQKTFLFDAGTCKYTSVFSGLIREPKEDYLKISKFESYKKDLTKIFKEHSLPEYFKNDKGNVTQESYKEGLKRYLEENKEKIEWDAPTFSDTQFLGWKEVAEDFLPHFFYVPAVKDASEEAEYASTNLFGVLIDDLFLESPENIAEFKELTEMLTHAGKLLNIPESGQVDKRPNTLKGFETSLLAALKETMPSIKDLEVEIGVPSVRQIVQSGTSLYLDDGIKTSVRSKGHGLQRALIFAIFRVYALSTKGKQPNKTKPFIFAVEEPELYLHPHHQRVLFQVLQLLAQSDQIIICTHSPYFIDMSQYDSLVVTSKKDIAIGTEVFQVKSEILNFNEKEYFKLLNEFNQDRNELFFAKKVLLVEGHSEKIGFPLIAKKLGVFLFSEGVTIVECGGKGNVPFFMKILNAFKIPYLVVHDLDPIGADEKDTDRIKWFKYNDIIKGSLDSNIGEIIVLDPEFDDLLGISNTQQEKIGKPNAVFNKVQEITGDSINAQLKDVVNRLKKT